MVKALPRELENKSVENFQTQKEAQDWIDAHPNNADVQVEVQCTQCKAKDWFWDSTLRYGPTGSIHEHLDHCHNCDGQNKDFITTKVTLDKEVIFQ